MTCLLFINLLLNGITGKIQGVVRDEISGDPISYANIVILNSDMGTATDDNGNFYILNVPAGRYTLEISCLGYQTKRVENVLVEIDQTYRLKASLKPTPIEMAPVIISGTTPPVKKDMVGSTYIIRKEEISTLPIDYIERLIAFQPSVANVDTALHVRGGRATEVLYMIDNVSIIDPQTGDPAIIISKGIVDEVIFLPGGFDVEYGRAMSGVVNLITEYPKDNLSGRVFGKTETIMPYYYDFGFQDYQASLHLPVSKSFKGLFAADLMHTDDWDPRLFILPHKQRDDYALYGKWILTPSGKLKIYLSGAKSRTQFDRFARKWMFNLDRYRSDLRKGDLEAININYLPDTRKLINITLSRLSSRRLYGVRELNNPGWFDDYVFRPYQSYKLPLGGNNNPFGVYLPYLPLNGDYVEYQDKSSVVLKGVISINSQIHKNHELRGGMEYSYLDLNNFTYYISDSLHQVTDPYHYSPKEYSVYLQDNIDFEGLYGKIGLRYDNYANGLSGKPTKYYLSPRAGFSFKVTENLLFRANVGRYIQPPLYEDMYGYYSLLPFNTNIIGMKIFPIVGNPDLKPEQTISYEIGLQGRITSNVGVTTNIFYKDISNLVGTRQKYNPLHKYTEYMNVEYANVKGMEIIFDYIGKIFSGKISYTLSQARGTSSYAEEVYYRYYYNNPDTNFTPATQEYDLDFDQPHRIFFQGAITMPYAFTINFFGYFGNGFPYTPPGAEGKTEERNFLRMAFRRDLGCVISKQLKFKGITLNTDLEIINLLDIRYRIMQNGRMFETPPIDAFDDYMSIYEPYYHPAIDINHDGLITPYEEYTAYRKCSLATDSWVEATSAPRRIRIGITLNFN